MLIPIYAAVEVTHETLDHQKMNDARRHVALVLESERAQAVHVAIRSNSPDEQHFLELNFEVEAEMIALGAVEAGALIRRVCTKVNALGMCRLIPAGLATGKQAEQPAEAEA